MKNDNLCLLRKIFIADTMTSNIIEAYKSRIDEIQTTIDHLKEEISVLEGKRGDIKDELRDALSKETDIGLYYVGKKSVYKIETKERCEWVYLNEKKAIFYHKDDAMQYIIDSDLEVWEEKVTVDTFIAMLDVVCMKYESSTKVPQYKDMNLH